MPASARVPFPSAIKILLFSCYFIFRVFKNRFLLTKAAAPKITGNMTATVIPAGNSGILLVGSTEFDNKEGDLIVGWGVGEDGEGDVDPRVLTW